MKSFEEFVEIVICSLNELLPAGNGVKRVDVQKDGIMLHGITIPQSGTETVVSPVIYLESFYQSYLDNRSTAQVVSDILAILKIASRTDKDHSADLSWSTMKNKVFPRLVNFEKNQESLKNLPFEQFLDLAVIYYAEIMPGNRAMGNLTIDRELMEMWGIAYSELKETALNNLRLYCKPEVESHMSLQLDVIRKSLNKAEINDEGTVEAMVQTFLEMQTAEEKKEKEREYLLASGSRSYGAEILLDTEVLDNLSQRLQADLWIIPVAQDTVQAVVVDEKESLTELHNETKSMDTMQTENEEFLSESIYLYNRNSGRLRCITEEEISEASLLTGRES